MDLIKKFDANWKRHNFPHKHQTVLVAVSGGKDSMALAFLLYQLGQKIALAHCNFQLRANDSDEDEQLVREWAGNFKIPIHVIKFDTQLEMERRKMGVQETARLLRYQWFQSLCKKNNYTALATAHHANDNVETLLINLCRGTGIAGLHGIPSKNDYIIRPLLFATRQEIDKAVEEFRIPYREDISNSNTKYLRNAVRHHIIPSLNDVFPDVINRINETINRIGQVEVLYLNAIEQERKALLEKRGADFYIPILKLQKRPAYEAICFEIFSSFGFSATQIPEILKLLRSESGHFVASDTYRVIRDRMFLIVTKAATEKTDYIILDSLPTNVQTVEGEFRFAILEKNEAVNDNKYTVKVDVDLLSLPIILRRWKTADYFYPLGMAMKKKKISRYLIDQKVPLHLKEKIWIVENDKKIVWVAGMRLDERFKITNKTKKVLQIELLLS
jgi:tRNA(Ile)-lysidine synthase